LGGAGRLFEAVAPAIIATGGKVLINAEVSEVAIENERAAGVKMKDGTLIRAPLVISDAGVMNTFGSLVARDVVERYRALPDPHVLQPSIAHLCLYLGLRHTAEELGLPKGNIWIYPDERHERTFAKVLEGADAVPLVYISFPAAKDPDFSRRHPGRTTIDVITLARWDAFARWADTRWKKRSDEYEAAKKELSERLLEVVYRYVPQVLDKIDVSELSTPLARGISPTTDPGRSMAWPIPPRAFANLCCGGRPHLDPRTPIIKGNSRVDEGQQSK
jgi:all-trans-retinol 13,14-reductase